MDKIYRHLLRLAISTLPLACLAMLASCSFEDEVGDCGGESATVRISVSAGEIGDLNGTRAGGDGLADEHEFMHSLRVYIVNKAGSVMQSFVRNPADLEAYSTAASTGDLTNWSSESFELAPGEYTVYAFANFEGHQGFAEGVAQPADNFIHTCFEDRKVNTTALNGFTVADPAGKIKFVSDGSGEVVYIPMSASQRITVTANTHDISIGLVRLVGKVQLTVSPDNAEIGQDATVTFSGYSQNVPLMESDQTGATGGNDYIYNIVRSLYGKRDASTTKDFENGSRQIEFYVNETPTGEPFTVTLNTGNTGTSGISTYEAKTKRTDIPRNSIYPLSLSFPDFDFNLTPTAWLYVTGVSYAVYYNVGINNVLTVEIATGSYFNFAPGNMSDSGGEYQTTWSWTVPEQQYEGLSTEISQNEIQGNVPGGQGLGNKYTLYLNGKWTASDGHSYDRTYTVIVDVCHDEAWAMANRIQGGSTTRGAKAGNTVYMLAPEYLNMFKTN